MATKKRTIPTDSLLRDEAKRVFGKDNYIRISRVAPWRVMVGNASYEVSVFNMDGEPEDAFSRVLACLTALPNHGTKQKKCSFCQKPGHVRKHCPDLERFMKG